jgi:hypothetical protein
MATVRPAALKPEITFAAELRHEHNTPNRKRPSTVCTQWLKCSAANEERADARKALTESIAAFSSKRCVTSVSQ